MKSSDQYIKLYERNTAAIDAGSGPALNRLRPAALSTLKSTGLPTLHNEGYEKTSIEEMFAPDYGVNISRVSIPVDIAASFRCDVPNLSTLTGFVINDSFVPSAGLDNRLPEGVTFMSLAKAAREMPETVNKHYGSLAPITSAPVALNTLLAQDGVFIHIHKGCRPEKALQIVEIFSAPVEIAAFRRMLIVVDDDADLRLLVCDHTQERTRRYLASRVIEVVVGHNARFEMCMLEESSAMTSVHSLLYMAQNEGSEALINATTLTCGNSRNEFDINLRGPHASARLTGMAIGGDRMHIDNNSAITHTAPHCHSDQLFKYVLDDHSTGAFEGSILVEPSAQFTEAYQSNRNILASADARMHCKPQLIIYNDDVKCSHGATTGQLDTDALFYMRQRGIPEAEARTMLMQAFMVDVIDTVHIPGLNERLRHLVERRFSGSLGDCPGCRAEN
ncbi:MAG: Fe-S cluster assembly protein SufD [Muribaculaceae bacterium]|nr:Fe-S cluster assembly protein SufD [Muribaculaceae bacterium]